MSLHIHLAVIHAIPALKLHIDINEATLVLNVKISILFRIIIKVTCKNGSETCEHNDVNIGYSKYTLIPQFVSWSPRKALKKSSIQNPSHTQRFVDWSHWPWPEQLLWHTARITAQTTYQLKLDECHELNKGHSQVYFTYLNYLNLYIS